MKCSRATLAVILSLFCAAPVIAGSLSLSPVGLDLPANQRAGSISLTNNGATPTSLQVRVFRWTQVDGQDVLEPTRDVLASPPAATIPGGDTYTVRVVRVAGQPVQGSESYRLVIDELPQLKGERDAPSAVSMLLRTSLPVFFTEPGATAQLTWALSRDANGIHLTATNSGGRHAKLAGLAVETAAGPLAFGGNLAGYVLPGSSRRFSVSAETDSEALEALTAGASVVVTARNGREEIRETVLVAQP